MRIAAVLGLALGLLACGRGPSPRLARLPPVMLWAWERDEDLRELPVGEAGVAYLRQTLTVRGDHLEMRPRRQPLRIPPGTALLAVTRISVPVGEAPALTEALAEALVAAMLRDLPPEAVGIQVDFDAARSQRPFYRGLLRRLRARLDPVRALSMTALASWALHDNWLEDLPVDEVVPMCFDMGADTRLVKEHLQRRRDFLARRARSAVGVALGEPLPWIPRGRRVYVFSHQPWTGPRLRAALREHAP